jgi:hypothetical protein
VRDVGTEGIVEVSRGGWAEHATMVRLLVDDCAGFFPSYRSWQSLLYANASVLGFDCYHPETSSFSSLRDCLTAGAHYVDVHVILPSVRGYCEYKMPSRLWSSPPRQSCLRL